MRLAGAVAVAVGLFCSVAIGAEKRLTLIFTGDNGGEIAPCG